MRKRDARTCVGIRTHLDGCGVSTEEEESEVEEGEEAKAEEGEEEETEEGETPVRL